MQPNVVRTLTVRGQSQGLDKIKSDLDAVSAAQVKVGETGDGMAKATETTARRQLSAGKDYERLMERTDRLVYLQRQMARDQQTVTRAFETGHLSVEKHAQSLGAVNMRYERLMASEQAARAQMTATTGAIDQQSASVMRLAVANDNLAAANDNARGSTANVAAQFQDIGVTAAMGMNPIMIALQQGTQLSAVLNTMQNPLKGLAMAFVSIINPVSLLTIGFVALVAAAIQFFTSGQDQAQEAVDALKEHNEWLDKLLSGYDNAREAAHNYREEASKLPEASVASDLATNREDAIAKFQTDIQRLVELQGQYQAEIEHLQMAEDVSFVPNPANDQYIADLRALVGVISDAGINAQSTAEQFGKLDSALNNVANSRGEERLVAAAEAALNLTREVNDSRIGVDELGASLNALPSSIVTTISVRMEKFGDAQTELAGLMPDFRDRYTKMRDEAQAAYETMRSNATDGVLRAQADNDLSRVMGGINRLQSEDEARKAEKSGGGRVSEMAKMAGNYADLTRKSQEFIAQQELTASSLGMTAEAAARLRNEQEMLNQAANDNIALSPAQRGEISGLAAEMAAAEERTRLLTESYSFGQQTLGSFLSQFRGDLMNGTSLWQAFGNAAIGALDSIAERALSMASNGLWDMLFGAIGGGLGGGMGGGFTSSITGSGGGFFPGFGGASLNALGNVYKSPSLSAYSNQIVSNPTMFAFERGAGLMGEAGPEAIMPLGRDGSGRLGVRLASQSGVRAANSNAGAQPVFAPVFNIDARGATAENVAMLKAELNQWAKQVLPTLVQKHAAESVFETGEPIFQGV